MNKLALVFPGQGSHYIGMGKNYYDRYSIAKETFDEANDILGFDLKSMCFEGSILELNRLENMFPALLVVSVAAFRAYMEEFGVQPFLTAGHSLGEYAALTCSGVIEYKDALAIVRQRGFFSDEISKNGTGGMSIVNNISPDVADFECRNLSNEEQFVAVSCYNSYNQVAVSGHQELVLKAEDRFFEIGSAVTPLFMSAPFHCKIMQPAADKLENELLKYKFSSFKWPVISNCTALPYKGSHEVVRNLALQITQPVLWTSTMKYMEDSGVNLVIELGAQSVLTQLLKENSKKLNAISYSQREDRRILADLLGKSSQNSNKESIKNKNNSTLVTRCLAIAVCTKNRNWNNDDYYRGVEEPYEKVVKMQEHIDKEGAFPNAEQMKEAICMLKSVFKTKKVPIEEQNIRFKQLYNEFCCREIFDELGIDFIST